MSSSQVPSKVHSFSIVSASSGTNIVYEVVEHVASEMSSSLALAPVVPQNHDNSSTGTQGGNNNDHTSINIDPNTEPVHQVPANEASVLLPRALWTVALLTLIPDIGTLLYKPATGVVFGHSTLAYYLTLAGIFTAGVIEAITAFWISRSRDVYKRRFSFGRVVLCASVGPFVVILGIGGSAFMMRA